LADIADALDARANVLRNDGRGKKAA